ncbi:MAG: hypothetical protein FJY67_05270 [Calditrichaeota bacterium]|nr:hypothetical protein [Calditrichota bacterium]
MKRAILILLLVAMVAAGPTFAGQFYGGKGLLHTNSALVLPPGALDMSLYMRGFLWIKASDNYVTNGTSALATAFGFSRHLELGFTQVLYQDLNGTKRPAADKNKTVVIPGNTFVRFKWGGYPIGGNLYWGIMPALRYRVALYQDVQFEPYEGIGIEAELSGLLSYYMKPLYPDEAPSFHLNLGYLNHNDGTNPGNASQGVNYLVSAIFPRPRFDYGVELYGSNFLKRPPLTTLGREDWAYMTPFVRYKLFKGMHFTMGLDVLLIGGEETSRPRAHNDLNYATWRISGKMNFVPSTSFYAAPTFVKADQPGGTGKERRSYSSSTGGGPTPTFSRQELFRWGIEERGLDAQSIDLDLEKIRQERKRAEEELQQLKQKLEAKQRREGQQ